ncbi:hypothetical protein E3U43_012052, partial [Larimichthys crocea]
MFCYKSTHLYAKNATVLYDDSYAEGSLWSRDNAANPLQPCSAPWTQDLQCTVCLDGHQDVYAMCRNLTHNATIVMEAGGKSVDIFKSDTQQWLLPVMIAVIAVIIVIISSIFIYKRWKSSRAARTR